jgi:peptidoglycan/LPS O-acetylase OafA/YrhL
MPPPHTQLRHRYTALDGLRGIGACIVAFFYHYQHFTISLPFNNTMHWAYRYGFMMVELFFVISGFVFFTFYRHLIANYSLSFKDFLVLRFSRLYPLHWLTLFFVFVVQIFRMIYGLDSFGIYKRGLIYFILNIPMLQTGWLTTDLSYNAPAWSLSVELVMYFIFFTVFSHGEHTKKYIIYFLLLIYAGLVIRFCGLKTPFFNSFISRGLTAFFTGCITASIHEFFAKHIKFEKCLILFLYIMVFISFFLPVLLIFSRKLNVFAGWDMCYTFVFFPALLLLILKVKFLSRLFSIKPVVFG